MIPWASPFSVRSPSTARDVNSTAGSGYSVGGGSWHSPRAEYLGAIGGTIYVWDGRTGRVRKEGSLGLRNGIWAAYSPDGRHVAAGGLGGDVVIIDTATGELVREPVRAHDSSVFWLSFSPDGSQLASSSSDGSVVLWDAGTGHITGRVVLAAGSSAQNSMAFLPDGNVMIVPFSGDPAVYLWDPSAGRAVEFECRAAGRDLTDVEWAEHFPGQPIRSVCPQGGKS